MKSKSQVTTIILKWYDSNARKLPWRIPPSQSKKGILGDPYQVWLSEVMLQQTTVKTVIPYYKTFLNRWPNIEELEKAPEEEVMGAWAGLGYYSRARNLIKCANIIVHDYDSVFPSDEESLLSLPGIGTYTAAAIRSIAFNKMAVVIDGNIERVISRLNALSESPSRSKVHVKTLATNLTPNERFGDYAQALMDLGSTICTPQKPKCDICPISADCDSFKRNLINTMTKRNHKILRQLRFGYAFIINATDNHFFLIRRPKKGLLGGMLAYPTSDWTLDKHSSFQAPFKSCWNLRKERVHHTFTHFDLELKIVEGFAENMPEEYIKQNLKTFDRSLLPSLMRKIFDLMTVNVTTN